MKERFEIASCMNNTDLSYDKNMISRFRNNLVGGLTDQVTLPKFIVVVPDNDIVHYFWYKEESDVFIRYSRLLKWIMSQYDRLICTQKEFLPLKAKKIDEPYFLWIQLPLHDRIHSKENRLRIQFNKALASVVTLHDNTFALDLKKGWDLADKSLYNRDERHFTAHGIGQYWLAVDKTVKYFETLLLKKK